ncbi:hypothetical protein ACFGVS_20405 [Mucilaginibacter sp. AW1-7]|uniref:hypothetical protein n=1 Tax=Mucilaginibacter sp. AW1-7 TaxID=3349874 RepID=UPI003F73AAB3
MQVYLPNEKKTVTPAEARKILAKHGTDLSIEDAKIMLELLYKLSKLSVSQVIKRALQRRNKHLAKNNQVNTASHCHA